MNKLQLQRRVEFCETDAAGVAHFSAFVLWMEQAEHELLRRCGLHVFTPQGDQIISWPRVSVHCDFHRPVAFADLVDIDVSVQRIGNRSITYQFHFSHQQQPIADGTMTAACCSLPQDDRPLQAVDIPPSFRAALQPYLS